MYLREHASLLSHSFSMSYPIDITAWNELLSDGDAEPREEEEEKCIICQDPITKGIVAVMSGSDKKYKVYVEVSSDDDDDIKSFSQTTPNKKVKVSDGA